MISFLLFELTSSQDVASPESYRPETYSFLSSTEPTEVKPLAEFADSEIVPDHLHIDEALWRSEDEPEEASIPATATPSDIVKSYKQELENRLYKAWLSPTLSNVRSYQEIQKDMMDRSKLFSVSWIQNVFQHPELDHTLISPVNQQGRHIKIDLEK